MSFPYQFYSSFQTNNPTSEWDSESDTGSLLDFPHLSKLSGLPFSSSVPFQGAYSARITMGDTNDHTLTEGDVDIASASTGWLRFYLNVVNLEITAADSWSILELQSPTSNTLRFVVAMNSEWTSGATKFFNLGIGGSSTTANWITDLSTNRWHCVEVSAKPANTTDAGAAIRQDNGAATLYVNAWTSVATSALPQTGGADASVGQAVLGTQDTLSTTTGTILLNEFVSDDSRVFPIRQRFPTQKILYGTHFAWIGPGVLDNVSLLSGGTAGNRLTVIDTDQATGYLDGGAPIKVFLRSVTANEIVDPAGMPVDCQRGCYVILEGANPRALVNIRRAPLHSQQGLKRWGEQWSPDPNEVI